MTWNYRCAVITHNLDNDGHREIREFGIVEVYYLDGKPESHTNFKNDVLSYFGTFKELKEAHRLIGLAFKEPIIDLDEFPNTWSEK
tara:strand:+ start:67 stop:324 length:258 start_codon:yes stop_codon:yes gene_type:complete